MRWCRLALLFPSRAEGLRTPPKGLWDVDHRQLSSSSSLLMRKSVLGHSLVERLFWQNMGSTTRRKSLTKWFTWNVGGLREELLLLLTSTSLLSLLSSLCVTRITAKFFSGKVQCIKNDFQQENQTPTHNCSRRLVSVPFKPSKWFP